MVEQAPDLDFLTLDYLAEVSMLILAKQRERDPATGFARDFIDVVTSLAPAWRAGHRVRVVTNAGGLNPAGCARAAAAALRMAGCPGVPIDMVTGDDVLPHLLAADPAAAFAHLETGRPLADVRADLVTGSAYLVTGSAYLGAAPVAAALDAGARLVITGHVADPTLTVGPCLHHFRWPADAYDRLAGATVAGHLIECGVRVTGGISTDWLTLPDPANIGFPIAEVSDDGSCVVTKPPGTGGRVDRATVSEQLLYEIGDPDHYLSPDATVSCTALRLDDDGPDRVRVSDARGRPPPATYKVSATYRAGFRAAGTLVVCGPNSVAKARRCGQVVLERLTAIGMAPERSLVEVLGAGDVLRGVRPGEPPANHDPPEVVLRIAVADRRHTVVERFTRELMPLVTAGPPGTTGYAEGRPAVREQFGYWPTLIDRAAVRPTVEIIES